MRHPARKALYCLLALAVGAALIRFGIGRHQDMGEDWTAFVPIMLGLAIVPFPLVILVQALFAIRGLARLLRGDGVIARWRVSPAEWAQFRGLDDRRSAEDFSLDNDLWIRKAEPAEPVEVIVGEKSASVDGSYHSLNPGGIPELRGVRWLEGPPTCLEFSLLYPRTRYGTRTPTTLRIPVPAGARSEAGRVIAHFEPLTRRSPVIALRGSARTQRICALLVLVAAAAGGIAWLILNWADPLVRIGLMIGAIILAIFAAIIALATFFLTRRA